MSMWVVAYGGGFFFFFKQKTAYEMRISDWSSDVCSSDLSARRRHRFLCDLATVFAPKRSARRALFGSWREAAWRWRPASAGVPSIPRKDRKSVVEGKSVSVRVDIGGRRIITKRQQDTT